MKLVVLLGEETVKLNLYTQRLITEEQTGMNTLTEWWVTGKPESDSMPSGKRNLIRLKIRWKDRNKQDYWMNARSYEV
jgi:hypothetical protein